MLIMYFLILYVINRFKNKDKDKYDKYSDVEPYIYNIKNTATNTYTYNNTQILKNSKCSTNTKLNSIKLKMILSILIGLLFPVFMIVFFEFMLSVEILIPLSFTTGLVIYIIMTYKDLKETLGSKIDVHLVVALISIVKLGELSFMVPFLVSVVFIVNTSTQIMLYYRNNPDKINQIQTKKPLSIKMVLIILVTIVITVLIGAYILWVSYFKENTIYELNSISVSSSNTFTYENNNYLYDNKNDIIYTIEVVDTPEYYLDLIENEVEQAAFDENVEYCYSLASALALSSKVNVMTVSVVTYAEDRTIESYAQIYYDIVVKKLKDTTFEAVSFFEKNGYVVKMVGIYNNEESREVVHDEFENFIETIII